MDYQELLLNELSISGTVDSLNFSDKLKCDHQKIVGAIKSIQSLENIITVEQKQNVRWELTDEGSSVANEGSHEYVVWKNIPKDGIKQDDLSKLVGPLTFKVGFSKAMQLGWIHLNKSNPGGPLVLKKIDNCVDSVAELCIKIRDRQLENLNDEEKNDCKKRKLASEIKQAMYVVNCGSNFSTSIEKLETELTHDMLINGSWKTKNFKKYNFDSLGQPVVSGHLHPLLKVRTQFRQIFLEMGFSEMPTNNYVESSFWNFDALFQPQQHPARDAHDTFFISDPENTLDLPMDYLNKVKQVHTYGGFGSQGYQYDWKLKEAMKNIMRTHTTSVSARMLYKLSLQEEFMPAKYFSIDRVFRNETLDMTHLAEFHQIEGLVADRGLSLANLMGYISEFFKKLGIKKLKYKPAYNPYTEPSMEIFSYHEGLKKWVEIGNSGVFRPEMLLPMGLPKDVSVIAWGLSLERPTMIKYGISNIRELFGPKIDLQKVYDNPICRLDK